ncbi:Unknown protein, partial [Striga hermonthica]
VTISGHDQKLVKVREELEYSRQTFQRLNTGKSHLDVLAAIEHNNNRVGLGFTPTMFVRPSEETGKSDLKSSPKAVKKSKQRRRRYVCHYCHAPGHIRPFCYKLHSFDRSFESGVSSASRNSSKNHVTRTKENFFWVPKSELKCNVIHTSLKSNIVGSWYFDSGCSRHMTGTRDFLCDIESYE